MADALTFPRLIYKGEPDTLGTGQDVHGRTLDSETKRVESQHELDAAIKDGWRVARELPKSKAEHAADERAATADQKAVEDQKAAAEKKR
jgi:hypothetical protein